MEVSGNQEQTKPGVWWGRWGRGASQTGRRWVIFTYELEVEEASGTGSHVWTLPPGLGSECGESQGAELAKQAGPRGSVHGA